MEPLPIDILRSIRKYLPLSQARTLRTLRKGMEYFHRFEIEELYQPETLETFIREDYQIGIAYLLKRYHDLYSELYPVSKIGEFIKSSNLPALYFIDYYHLHDLPWSDMITFSRANREFLYQAITMNDIPLVDILLKLGIHMRYKEDELIFAIKGKHYDVVRYLLRTQYYKLNRELDPEDYAYMSSIEYTSPLMAAIETGELPMVKILVGAGASVIHGYYPMTTSNDFLEIIQYLLLMRIDLGNLINVALSRNDFNMVKFLVRAGVTVESEHIINSLNGNPPEVTYYLINPD